VGLGVVINAPGALRSLARAFTCLLISPSRTGRYASVKRELPIGFPLQYGLEMDPSIAISPLRPVQQAIAMSALLRSTSGA
jgi:hypothetical protein